MKLTEKHLKCIHLMILDRFDRSNQTEWVSGQVGVRPRTISDWKEDPDFQAEYQRQLEMYRNNFDDIKLADRKERVRVLSDLFEVVEDVGPRGTKLKMALIEQIRMEMGIGEPENVRHLHAFVGVNTPPRAENYDEWVKQNTKMEKARPILEPLISAVTYADDSEEEDAA
jgi:hypothetical protein